MTAVFCRNTADRKAPTWERQLVPFTHLEFAVSDAAKGIAAAVAQVVPRPGATTPRPRRWSTGWTSSTPPWKPTGSWPGIGDAPRPAWEQAEQADAKVAGAKRQGIDARGPAGAAGAAWRRATAAFEQAQRLESAWGRAACRAGVVRCRRPAQRPHTGRSRDRRGAEGLAGPDWSKVRNFLTDRRSLAFLDRMHRRLGAAEPRSDWREAMAWRWWLRHGRVGPSDPITELVQAVGRERPRAGRGGGRQL